MLGALSSRLGLGTEAVEAAVGMDLHAYLVDRMSRGGKVDYVIVDEAQFLAPDRIDRLARLVELADG